MSYSQFDYKAIYSGINTQTGDYWEIGFGYLLSGEVVGKNAFEIAGELNTGIAGAVTPVLVDVLPSNVEVANLSVKKLGGTGGPPAISAVGLPGSLSACETIGNGALITWYGDVDPILQGRTYLPGIPNDSLDAGAWDAAYATAVVAFAAGLETTLTVFTEVADFCIQSSQIGINSQVVRTHLLRPVPGTQRRRLRR